MRLRRDSDLHWLLSADRINPLVATIRLLIATTGSTSASPCFRPVAQIKDLLAAIGDNCLWKREVKIKAHRLIEWRDWLDTCDEDLIVCATKPGRRGFDWPSPIEPSGKAVKAALRDGACDLHFHASGSTDIFALNWVALHNQDAWFCKVAKQRFEQFVPSGEETLARFERSCVLARVLRRYLLDRVLGALPASSYRVGQAELGLLFLYYLCELNMNDVASLAVCNTQTTAQANELFVDYAEILLGKKAQSWHSGERAFLAACFRRFSKKLSTRGRVIDSYIFWLYLVLRREIASYFLFMGDEDGFSGFSWRQKISRLFIGESSDSANIEMLGSINKLTILSGIEYRLPVRWKKRQKHACGSNPLAAIKSLEKAYEALERGGMRPNHQHRYLVHFSKWIANPNISEFEDKKRLFLEQAKDIVATCGKIDLPYIRFFRGIDAAGGEQKCPPFVFGPAYRYLKSELSPTLLGTPMPCSYVRTYHVGEDFEDLLTGIRRIWEAVEYLSLAEGDRLGHALALGIEPSVYYKGRKTFGANLLELVDNAIWIRSLTSQRLLPDPDLFNLLSRILPKTLPMTPTVLDDYFDYMLLRSDFAPDSFEGAVSIKGVAQNESSPLHQRARSNLNAAAIQKEGLDWAGCAQPAPCFKSLGISETDAVSFARLMQGVVVGLIRNKGIVIESNPSSNRYIGQGIVCYSDLPLYSFLSNNVPTVIGTDDQGLFNTNLFVEYAIAQQGGELRSKELKAIADLSKSLFCL